MNADPKPMTLAEALDVAIGLLRRESTKDPKRSIIGAMVPAVCREAATVLREFRERGLPLFEAAEANHEAEAAYQRHRDAEGPVWDAEHIRLNDAVSATWEAADTAYRRWKEEA